MFQFLVEIFPGKFWGAFTRHPRVNNRSQHYILCPAPIPLSIPLSIPLLVTH